MAWVDDSLVGRGWVRAALLSALAGAVAGCGAGEVEHIESREQLQLNADQKRILGFESPTSDWSLSPATSSVASQGVASGRFAGGAGELDIVNQVSLASLGPVGDTLTLDVNPSVAPSWGYVRVVLVAPSLGHYWTTLGERSLTGLAPGQFTSLTFDLSSYRAALSSTYSDLKIHVFLNGPQGNYLLDNLELGGEAVLDEGGSGGTTGGGGTSSGGATSSGGGATTGGSSGGGSTSTGGSSGGGGGTSEPTTFLEVRTPKGITWRDVVFGSMGRGMAINDHASLWEGTSRTQRADVSATDSTDPDHPGVIVGVDTQLADITAEIGVYNRAGRILGTVRTSDTYEEWAHNWPTPPVHEGVNLSPNVIAKIPYTFTDTFVGAPTTFLQNGGTYAYEPGNYPAVSVQAQSTIVLSAGEYHFERLLIEDGSSLILDNAEGPVFVFVRSEFRQRGSMAPTVPSKHNVLLGYLGTAQVEVEEYFGMFVAPSARINFLTDNFVVRYRGAFFARGLIAHQWTDFEHYVFERDDCATACGNMFGCNGKPLYLPCDTEDPPPTCTSDADCEPGLECGQDNGGHFGASRTDDYCWDGDVCETDAIRDNCGTESAACGLCGTPAVPCEDDSDCPSGDICGTGNGIRFRSPAVDVCEPAFCSDEDLPDEACGTPDSPCGICACTPNCSSKSCGDDPKDGCGGVCVGLCAGGEPGCTSSLDCASGELCVGAPGATECRPVECVTASPLSSECDDGLDACGEPCQEMSDNVDEYRYEETPLPPIVPGDFSGSPTVTLTDPLES